MDGGDERERDRLARFIACFGPGCLVGVCIGGGPFDAATSADSCVCHYRRMRKPLLTCSERNW